jgi:hypothetical protein
MDDDRLYTVDNSAIVGAFDLKTGAKLWEKPLGTLQKGSPLLADGKLYVGTENGHFYILKPSATNVEVLDDDLLGTAQTPEPIIRVADCRGRPRLRDVDGCDLRNRKRVPHKAAVPPPPSVRWQHPVHPAVVQVFRTNRLCRQGKPSPSRRGLFDAKGTSFARSRPRSGRSIN